MELTVVRKWKKDKYTIGELLVNNVKFSETLEDTDRGLKDTMPLSEIKAKKIYGKTAIPTGTYNIRMDIVSPKYNQKLWAKHSCNGGKMPRLENVKGYDGVLIHPGNNPESTYGCLLVGRNTIKGGLTESRNTFLKLYNMMYAAYKRGEKIRLTIK